MCVVSAFFWDSDQKQPGGYACAARRLISLCMVFGSELLNRLAGMNICQATRLCLRFQLNYVLCRGIETSDGEFMH